jgi:hypothetical protein
MTLRIINSQRLIIGNGGKYEKHARQDKRIEA